MSGCYRWPDSIVTTVAYTHVLARGTIAYDFTLNDITGVPHSLSALLKDRPVVLVLGSFT